MPVIQCRWEWVHGRGQCGERGTFTGARLGALLERRVFRYKKEVYLHREMNMSPCTTLIYVTLKHTPSCISGFFPLHFETDPGFFLSHYYLPVHI